MSGGPWPGTALRPFAGALALFSGVLAVSRLGDLGVVPVPANEGGARGDVALAVEVLPAEGGAARPLDVARLHPGDRLRLSHGPTRYLGLWALEVEPTGALRPLLPADPGDSYGLKAAPGGGVVPEVVALGGGPGERTLLVLFTSVPHRFEALQAAARRVPPGDAERIARELPVAGRSFVRALRIEPRSVGTSSAAR
jgi:hypothetical protein